MNVTGPIPQELWSLVYISNLYASHSFSFLFCIWKEGSSTTLITLLFFSSSNLI